MSVVELQKGMTDLIPCNASCGGDYENYSFGQTEKEVTVTIPLTPGTSAKMVSVEITASSLRAGLKGKEPVLSGQLFKPIKASESTWCVQDKKELVIILVKTNLKYEEWWPLVVEGQRQIDMKTLKPPEVRLSELDDGAQATVARMMLEQRQKRASGLLDELPQ